MINLRSRNLRNSLWNLGNTVFYPLGFLALTPYFIDGLGEHLFGAWMVLNSIVFISVHVLHFGMGPSIAMYVAEARGQSNQVRLNRYFNASLNFTTLVAIAIGVIGLLLWLFSPVDWFAWEGISDPSDLRWAMILTVGVIVSKFYEQLFGGFFKGFEEYDTAAKFNMIQKLSMLGLQVLALMNGYGLSGIIFVSFGTNLLLGVAQFIWSLRYLTEYKWTPNLDGAIFQRLGVFGFWSWIQAIISLLSFQLDRLLVAFALGTDVVAYYSLASMIANHLHVILEASIGWIFPAVSRIIQEKGDPRPLYITVRNSLMVLALSGLTLLYLIREPLFTLWLGTEKAAQALPFIELFILLEVFYVVSILPKFYLNGLSRLKLITSIELGYKTLGIISMLTFFYIMQTAESLIWGQIFSMMLTMPLEMYLVNRFVLHDTWWKESLLFVLPCFVLLGALIFLPSLYASAALGLVGILIFGIYLKHPDFKVKLLLE